MNKRNCWEFKGCNRAVAGNGRGGTVCPAAEDTTLSGINSGRNGGRICWMLAGTFSSGIPIGQYVRDRTSCISCDFFKLVEAEEGGDFEFFTADQLSRRDPYIYGTRKSMRFPLHLDIKVRLARTTNSYFVGVTSNISQDGLSFVSENFESAPRELLELRLRYPRNTADIAVSAEMVWKRLVRDRCLAGVRIREMDLSGKRAILNNVFNEFRAAMRNRQP